MTQTQKIIALAELEGWTNVEFCPADIDGPEIYQGKQNGQWHECKPYLTSHDALQPILKSMTIEQRIKLSKEMGSPGVWMALTMEAEPLADCILKACGKWEE